MIKTLQNSDVILEDCRSTDFKVAIQCMTYNHAPFIEEAMNGFCMQRTTFPFVAVIVDDASTDGEPEVIKKYLDVHFEMSKARIWESDEALFIEARHNENLNCTFAVVLLKYNFWQAKKDKAPLIAEWMDSAQYIALCEGDDYWTQPDKLQRQTEILERHNDCSFCVHDYTEWNQNKGVFDTHDLPITRSRGIDDVIYADINDFLTMGFFTKTLTCLYRKESLAKSKFQYYEAKLDMNFFFALMTQGYCCFINKKMGCYRVHDGGITKGDSWTTYIDGLLPKQFSIIKVEQTSYSQRYVYGWMSDRIVSLFVYRKFSIIKDCVRYLGLSNNFKLFFCALPKQTIEIIINKFFKK